MGASKVVVWGVSVEAPLSVVSSAVESSAGVSLIWVSATANVLLGTRAKRVRANVGIDLTPGQTFKKRGPDSNLGDVIWGKTLDILAIEASDYKAKSGFFRRFKTFWVEFP